MSDRKHTPDVLADILGGTAPEVGSASSSIPESEAPGVSSPKRPAVGQLSAPTTAERALAGTAPPLRKRERLPVGQRQDRQPPLWEYIVVSCQDHHGWRPRYVNGFEACGWTEGPLIHDYLEQRGQEGWELVGVAAGKPMYSVSDAYQLYFRRARR